MSKTTSAEWAKRVERWKDSGLSAKEFAAETGLNASTLTYWSWKLRAGAARSGSADDARTVRQTREREARRSSKASPRFVEVSTAITSSPMSLELVLSRGMILRVPTGFDEATLMRAVRALEAAQ